MDKPSDVYSLSRKYWLIKVKMFFKRLTSLLLVALLIIFAGCSQQITEQQIISRAKVIHKKALTLDTHVDILNARYATKARDPGIDNPKLKCDLVKMNKGGVDGVFLAAYARQKKRDAEGYKNAYKSVMGQLEAIHRLAKKMYPDRCELATSPGEVERTAKTGKRVIMIGVENGFPIGKDLLNVERFYNLGARYITLSHNGHNDICDSCNPRKKLGDRETEHNGLSEFGKEVVAEMNRLGIIADVSHISVKSFYDLIKVSRAPIIASHSGCRALADNSRNLDDEQLKALARNGGVIQIVAVGGFLRLGSSERRKAISDLKKELELEEERIRIEQFLEGMKEIDAKYPSASLTDFVDHIDHAVKVAGIEHVGIGSDFDGGGGVPGFNDHSEALNVTIELVKRGYSEEDISKIWGANLLRVWREVEKVAQELQKGSNNG
jgi:microsomal dipeptidase-like Zn-dependent dipeptidase